MNGCGGTTLIRQGDLGFPGLSDGVGCRHLDTRSDHRGPAAGDLAVDRHDDGPGHGRGGGPVLISDGLNLDLGCRHRSARI